MVEAPIETLNEALSVRYRKSELVEFRKLCKAMKSTPADMMREFVTAFNDERMTIKPTEAQLQLYKGDTK